MRLKVMASTAIAITLALGSAIAYNVYEDPVGAYILLFFAVMNTVCAVFIHKYGDKA